jgi:hypothetical protein
LASGRWEGSSELWISTETRSWISKNSNKRWLLTGKVVHHARLFPKKVELQAMMKFYDIDGDGNVSYEEFLSGLR